MKKIFCIARSVVLEVVRKKDVYVLFILLGALLFVLMSLDIFGLGHVVRYILDVGLLFTWLFSIILSVSVAARQLPQEETRGTIFPLLAKPVTRLEVILGKWLGAWFIVAIAVAAFYGLIVAVGELKGASIAWITLIQALAFHLVFLSILCALTLALTTRLTQGAAVTMAGVVLVFVFVFVPHLSEMAMFEKGFRLNALLALHYALPHFEFFDLRQRLVHAWGPIPWRVFFEIIIYGFLWSAFLLTLGWLGFRKKKFVRGAQL